MKKLLLSLIALLVFATQSDARIQVTHDKNITTHQTIFTATGSGKTSGDAYAKAVAKLPPNAIVRNVSTAFNGREYLCLITYRRN